MMYCEKKYLVITKKNIKKIVDIIKIKNSFEVAVLCMQRIIYKMKDLICYPHFVYCFLLEKQKLLLKGLTPLCCLATEKRFYTRETINGSISPLAEVPPVFLIG